MFRNYFKTAIRTLFRNRIYSVINISGLSLGLACAMLIILYLKDELSFDRWHTKADRIYRLYTEGKDPAGEVHRMGITGDIQGPRFKSQIPEIRAFVRIQGGYVDVREGREVYPQNVLNVDSNFFSVFSFPLLSGDPATALVQPNSAVLSEDAANKYFGSTEALGKTLLLKMDSGFKPYTVTGIAKRCPQNSSIQFDVLLSKRGSPATEQGAAAWTWFFETTYMLLDPRANIKAVEDKMTAIFIRDNPEMVKRMEEAIHRKPEGVYRLQPFTDIHLNANMDRNNITGASDVTYSYILSGIAFFILLIACINFVNLTVARSLKRAKEIGVRKVTGGTRQQLIFQFLGESFILCAIAFVVALVLVQALLPLFNRLANKELSLSYLLDLKLVCGYIVLFLLTGLLAGFYPALVLSGFNPVQTLYGRIRLGGRNYLQKSLVVLQFTLSTFLIGATFVLFSQLNFLMHKDPGYDNSNLVLVNKQDLTPGEAQLFKTEMLKSPGIIDVTAKDADNAFNAAKINGGDSMIGFANMTVDETFLPLLKIPVLQGRNFSRDFPGDSTGSVLVNESFVKKAGWKDPIGQQVTFGEKEKYRVIGVVRDYAYNPLNEAIEPELFSMRLLGYGMVYIKIKPKSETASLAQIEKTFKRLFPLSPFSYRFKDEENRKSLEAEGRWKQILLFASLVTIFISCVGLFGLSVFSVEKRTKEIGVRKVLGASSGVIVGLVSKDFLRLVFIALLIALPAVWMGADKWLQRYPFRITVSVWMFAGVGLVVVLIALVTVSFQSVKAAMTNPVESLRSE
jgi:putative ABC transport system permease protein